MQRSLKRSGMTALGIAAAVGLALSGCNANAGGETGSNGKVTLTVAAASVPQFDDIKTLTSTFEADHPNITVKYVSLPEDQLRDQLTQGVATGSSPYDVIAVGPYEAPIWAKNGWLEDITDYAAKDSDYDLDDVLAPVRAGLGADGELFAVPFSGESSMLMYRKDLFEAKGLEMPANPTWTEIEALASQVEDPSGDIAGICMRGSSGWGSSLAALNPIINSFGGVWYDEDWKPSLDSAEAQEAVNFYVNMQQKHGVPGAASNGFPECLTAFGQGRAAMWFDATSAGASVENPEISKVGGKVGYANAPVESWKGNGWLWSWNLAMTSTSKNKDAAWEYMSWATSKDYVKLVGTELSWNQAPAATRASTYEIPEYLEAAPYAQVTLDSISNADPTEHPVKTPYTGILFLGLPAYQDFGTQISQEVSAAIAGNKTPADVTKRGNEILAEFADGNKSWTNGSK